MNTDNRLSAEDLNEDEPAKRFFRLPGFGPSLLIILILAALLAFDLQDLLMAGRRQQELLSLLKDKQGERLTQIERELNEARYFTRYSDEPSPWLRVSTLSHFPLLYRLAGAVAPGNSFSKSLGDNLTNATTIILIADKNGAYIHELTGDYQMNLRLLKATGHEK